MSRRIWHLSSNRWNSAITEYALSAARALQLVGETCIFTPLSGSPAEKRASGCLDTWPLSRFSVDALPRLLTMAKDAAPDVIVTYGGSETFLAKALKLATGARVIRFRGQALEPCGFAFGARHRFAHAHVDTVLTPSTALAAAVRRVEPERQVQYVQLGCDNEIFHRVSTGPAKPRPEMVLLGRFDPVKGHAAMMRLTAALLRANGSLRPRLHIVGEPANLSVAQLEADAAASGLTLGDDVVITARRVDHVAELLSSAALGVVPSLGSEIICRVAEEFLLCGTPVAVSGVGSLDEVLFTPDMGFTYSGLSEAETVHRLGDWLGISLGEGEERKTARAAAASGRFSLEAMGQALARLL